MSDRIVRELLLLSFALTSFGCGVFGPPQAKIADLKSSPSAYSNKEVRIHGTVTNALKIPFVATKIYSVQDDTGEMTVTTEGAAPTPGAEVDVVGMLDTVATIGTQSIGLHIREKQNP